MATRGWGWGWGVSDQLSLTNKPRCWEKKKEPAEGWIIKYAWYSTMFHSAQMSHSGTQECYGIPVRLLCLNASTCPPLYTPINKQQLCVSQIFNTIHASQKCGSWGWDAHRPMKSSQGKRKHKINSQIKTFWFNGLFCYIVIQRLACISDGTTRGEPMTRS